MVVEDQIDEMFAGNRHVLSWAGIENEDATGLLDLTGRIVRFALCRFKADGTPNTAAPVLDYSSDDVGSPISIPNPVLGSPHVEVELPTADTLPLAPKETDYYFELEVFESDGSDGVVVATGTLKIKKNAVNAA